MEERVSHLDTIMAELAHAQMRTEISLNRLERSQEEQGRRFEEQGRRFEEQGKRFEEQGRRFEDQGKHFGEQGRQMNEALNRMDRNIAEMKSDTRLMKKAWGDLANKMGTVAEDVVAPNIPRLAVKEFGMAEVEDLLVRARRSSRRGQKRSAEYDVVCSGPGKVIVVDVKSTPTLEKIREVPDRLVEFFDFFPEYEDRELIGVFASWSIDEKLLPAISAAGLYGIAMGDETMDIVARPEGG